MTVVVISAVSQPPLWNFSSVVMIRMVRQRVSPTRCTARFFFHFSSRRLFLMENRDIPSWESEKSRKTLIEYITTSVVIDPWVYRMSSMAAPPMSSTPFWIVNRSESEANRWGNQ